MKGFFITATDTGVGKTLVSTLLLIGLNKKNIKSIHFKPIQSGIIKINDALLPPDLVFSGHYLKENNLKTYCKERNSYTFKTPVSPHLSAEIDNQKIDYNEILKQFNTFKDVVVAEGAGGLGVPISDNKYIYNLIEDFKLETIIVTRANLGTLNHTFLTSEFLKQKGITPFGIVVSGVSQKPSLMEKDNLKMIEKMTNIKIIAKIPKINIDTETPPFPTKEKMEKTALTSFNWEKILNAIQ
jgi:dethiobiotin synthetase